MIEQGTIEWRQQRCGKVTASRVHDIIAKTKTGYSASRANYMAELIVERLTGNPVEGYTNAAMQWGTDQEPMARAAYEFLSDNPVEQVGFIEHPRIPLTGCSPDGLVGADGLLEAKCPNTATHIETLLGGEIALKYFTQMQWQMACCERDFCDFVSFDPRLPASMQIHITRVKRDQAFIVTLEREVAAFLDELAQKVDTLCRKYETKAAA